MFRVQRASGLGCGDVSVLGLEEFRVEGLVFNGPYNICSSYMSHNLNSK